MTQLSNAPGWAQCRLPARWETASTTAYVTSIGTLCKMLSKRLVALRRADRRKGAERAVNATRNKGGALAVLWKKLGGFRPAKRITGVLVKEGEAVRLLRDPSVITHEFCASWANMFQADPSPRATMEWGNPPQIPTQDIKGLTAAIEPLEFDTALAQLAQGSPGDNSIDANILQALPDAVLQQLCTSMSNLMVHQLPLPDSWKSASITLLPKDGSGADPMNYRPISLLQVQYKLYTSIITARLSKVVN